MILKNIRDFITIISLLLLLPNSLYSQSIPSYNNGVYGSMEIDSFNTNIDKYKTKSLEIPELIYPPDNAEDIPVVPGITIGTVKDADRYEIQVSADSYFSFNIISSSYWQFEAPLEISELLFIPAIIETSDFENETKYYWRARALANDQTEVSPWSDVYEYETVSEGSSIDPPTITEPQENTTNSWIELKFGWTERPNAKRYQIQISEDYSFDGFTYRFPKDIFQKFNLEPQTSYYARVLAYSDRTLSAFSNTVEFSTGDYAELTKDEYTFTDGSGTENYENNLEVSWLIEPDNGNKITLTFEYFETETNDDYVSIFDGGSSEAPLINTFSGNQLPPQIESSDNQLFIKFSSDWSITKEGWKVSYTSNEKSWSWPVIAPRITQDFATYNSVY